MTFAKWIAAILLCLSWILNSAPAQSPPLQAPPPVESAKDAHPESADAFAQARLLLQRWKYDEAADQLKQLQGQRPRLKVLGHELAIAYYRIDNYPKAM